MIRETQTDSPGTGPSYVVHPTVPGTRHIRRAAPSPADTRLDVANQTLIGRKGPYVIYIPADAIGAETFTVLRLSDGHQLYQDNKSSGPNAPSHAGLLAVTLDADTLHLRYQRQVSAPCSLPQDGAACWTKTVKKNHLNRALAALTPSLADCRATYKTAAVPPSTTSTIVHDVDMIISPTGKTTVLSRGQPACAAPD